VRRGNLQESWRSVVPTPKIWDSEAQVALINQWRSAHAKIVSEPEDRPWKLREFMAADLDDNLIRVFDDFRGNMQKTAILVVAPLSTQLSTRRVAHRNRRPGRSRRLHKKLRRRAESRLVGPARARSRLHAPEVRAAGPT